jgi:hypothetical protein
MELNSFFIFPNLARFLYWESERTKNCSARREDKK